MIEDLHPKTEHHPLPRELKQVDPQILKYEFKRENDDIEQGDYRQPRQVPLKDMIVYGHLGQIGPGELKERAHDKNSQGEEHQPPVGTEVLQKATHESKVINPSVEILIETF
jgi:hypothetical protein